MSEIYDYEKGLERINKVLTSKAGVNENVTIPQDSQFTFENAYYGWVSAIFVDIRNSTKLFANGNRVEISKVIRSFTSEIIEILRKGNNLREIGIRGDCVFAVYATPSQDDIYTIADLTFWSNTFMKLLNKRLQAYSLSQIKVGIGMATDKELVVKAGRDGVGINSKVWIGKAVTYASKLSGMANKDRNKSILFSSLAYSNLIDALEKKNPGAKLWFTKRDDSAVGECYMADIIKADFNDWIQKL